MKRARLGLKVACDALLFGFAFAIASVAWLGRPPGLREIGGLVGSATLLIALKVSCLHLFGAYRSLWRYTGVESLEGLASAGAAGALGACAIGALSGWTFVPPPRVLLLDAVLGLLLVAGARIAVRLGGTKLGAPEGRVRALRGPLPAEPPPRKPRALIVGAGDAGEMLVREILRGGSLDYDPVGFVDDDARKAGLRIHGIPVAGSVADIRRLVRRLRIETILIAIPSASRGTIASIVGECRRTRADVRIVPDFGRLMDASVGLSGLHPVEIKSLLGRNAPVTSSGEIARRLAGRRVLVTGAGGSIGSELSRQILRYAPASLVLLGRGENSIHAVHQELAPVAGSTRLVQVIASVTNARKLSKVFEAYRPQVVFHAAADKHVPLMEAFPDEAVLNNVVGTRNVLELANATRCERVVCISSDKAVHPSSVMGCSKRIAELLVRSPLYPNTCATAVRFGNVFASRGSVIPQFHEQIAAGGPITVTHRGMTRYFMTIPEAVELVLAAGAMARGREIYVLDMGSRVRIWDLAEGMARLRGLEPGVDIEVTEIGLRPGEKLHEELYVQGEHQEPTGHPRITCTRHPGVDPAQLRRRIDALVDRALSADADGIRKEMTRLVPEYRAPGTSEDRARPRIAARTLEAVRPA